MALVLGPGALDAPASADTTDGASALAAGTAFAASAPNAGATAQIADLTARGRTAEAALIARTVATPTAVWFTSGSPQTVERDVARVVQQAAAQDRVPTLVAYNVPGRDCSQYSSGGAGSDAAYRAWVDGFAAGLDADDEVVVVVEPDGLAALPSDCPGAHPGQDVAALTTGRIADIRYAAAAVERAAPGAHVYLDAGTSSWRGVSEMARRLDRAGVRDVAGFSLNVSNHVPTDRSAHYGTWVSGCLAAVGAGSAGFDACPGVPTGWAAADVAATTATYTRLLGGTAPTARFVVDTSRNGQGTWTPTTSHPDPQTWCNAPGRGLGAAPQVAPSPAFPLLDAVLWVKRPGESDGQCTRGRGESGDPEWGGIVDPPAGSWFPQQALQLAQLAAPAATAPTVPAPTVPAPTAPAPTVPAPTAPAPTVPAPRVPAPTVPGPVTTTPAPRVTPAPPAGPTATPTTPRVNPAPKRTTPRATAPVTPTGKVAAPTGKRRSHGVRPPWHRLGVPTR